MQALQDKETDDREAANSSHATAALGRESANQPLTGPPDARTTPASRESGTPPPRPRSARTAQQLDRLLARRQAVLLELVADFIDAGSLDSALQAIADTLQQRFPCARVALGVWQGTAMRVAAISQQGRIEASAAETRQLALAMHEAADQDRIIQYPAAATGQAATGYRRRRTAPAGACSTGRRSAGCRTDQPAAVQRWQGDRWPAVRTRRRRHLLAADARAAAPMCRHAGTADRRAAPSRARVMADTPRIGPSLGTVAGRARTHHSTPDHCRWCGTAAAWPRSCRSRTGSAQRPRSSRSTVAWSARHCRAMWPASRSVPVMRCDRGDTLLTLDTRELEARSGPLAHRSAEHRHRTAGGDGCARTPVGRGVCRRSRHRRRPSSSASSSSSSVRRSRHTPVAW